MKLIHSFFYLLALFSLLVSEMSMAQDLSVMSFNIRYDNPADSPNDWDSRKEALLGQIIQKEVDFLGTQEVLFSQLQFIATGLEQSHQYVGVGRDDGKEKGEFSALFYKNTDWTLLNSNTFWLSETPNKISVGWDASMERICTYGYFEHQRSKKRIWVFNTHFDHIGENARKQSAALILSEIDRLNTKKEAVLLMGDLNMTPDMQGIKNISAHLKDPISSHKKSKGVNLKGSFGTFNGFQNKETLNRRIDYIFTSGLVPTKYAHIDKTFGPKQRFVSDHFAVWLQAKL